LPAEDPAKKRTGEEAGCPLTAVEEWSQLVGGQPPCTPKSRRFAILCRVGGLTEGSAQCCRKPLSDRAAQAFKNPNGSRLSQEKLLAHRRKIFYSFACSRAKEAYADPVKRSLSFCASAILFGALVALLLHAARPHPWSPQRGAKLFGRLPADPFAWFELAQPAAKPPQPTPPPPAPDLHAKSIGVVVLAEPVVVLYDNHFNGRQIPRGTRMDVLREEGKYLEVRFGPDVVMIPRTATVGRMLLASES
jgi:hypothetical protein